MRSVRFLGPDTDAYVASVQRHASEFEEQTGLELDIRIVPSDLYFSNKIHHLLDGDDAADVYMSGPVLVWEHLAAGFVQPLDDFLARAGDGYDMSDFIERLLTCNRWSGRFGGSWSGWTTCRSRDELEDGYRNPHLLPRQGCIRGAHVGRRFYPARQ